MTVSFVLEKMAGMLVLIKAHQYKLTGNSSFPYVPSDGVFFLRGILDFR